MAKNAKERRDIISACVFAEVMTLIFNNLM